MAKPLPDEELLYKRIKHEHITINPIIWELINHHVKNDLMALSLCLSKLHFTPRWILNIASAIIFLLYKISLHPGKPPQHLLSLANIRLERVKNVDLFLRHLRETTR